MQRISILKTVAVIVVSLGLVLVFTYPDRPRGPGDMAEQSALATTILIQGSVPTTLQPAVGRSLLDHLKSLDENSATLRLETKTYEGMGTLVTSMNGLTNGADNKYWQYKVNGVMPQIGADAYIPIAGDSIEWYFAASAQ